MQCFGKRLPVNRLLRGNIFHIWSKSESMHVRKLWQRKQVVNTHTHKIHTYIHTCMFDQLIHIHLMKCFYLDDKADTVSNSSLLLCLVLEVASFKETECIHILQNQESRSYMKVDLWYIHSPFLCSQVKLTFPSNGLVIEVKYNT